MRKAGHLLLVLGLLAMVICVLSRVFIEPIQGIEAHAINAFAQTLLLAALAFYIGEETSR